MKEQSEPQFTHYHVLRNGKRSFQADLELIRKQQPEQPKEQTANWTEIVQKEAEEYVERVWWDLSETTDDKRINSKEDFINGANWYRGVCAPRNTVKQQWISVKDRFPDFDTPVIVYCRVWEIYIARYIYIGDFEGVKYGNWHDGTNLGVLPPTHWMPLPEPPK